MKLSYDLIIIGGTLEGIFAAEYAVSLGARTALIIPDYHFNQALISLIINQIKLDFSQVNNKIDFSSLIKTRKLLITEQILPQLERLGVDIIIDKAKFDHDKNLILKTNKHNLQASAYLLATSAEIWQSQAASQLQSDYLTIHNLINQSSWHSLPKNLVIIGDDLSTINLGKILRNLGKKITIITPKQQLLPSEDENISFSIQANLEAQGIEIFTNCQVKAIKVTDGFKWLQLGDKNIKTEEVIITNLLPNFAQISGIGDELGLKKLGIDLSLKRVLVNPKLQTSHPQIYACGDLLGGYSLVNLSQAEAKIAVKNALIAPIHHINYQTFPYLLTTYPPILRVGYTETQARQIYGNNLKIIKFRIQPQLSHVPANNLATLVKIILDDNNYIVGSHFFNLENQEIITAISLIMQQNKTIKSLFKSAFCDIYSLEIIKQIYHIWRKQNLAKNQLIMNLLETLFIWKRR
jgi:pyruvate/2-oxoglutarate dehydrogenase complex dihydrolipoamide dehydrogenase (E3) component